MRQTPTKTVAIIVAHPDDETLWAGGMILQNPSWQCIIVCLCRVNDEKRAPKFYSTLEILQSTGVMGDLDDAPEQKPLDETTVENAILALLPPKNYDLIITHNPNGEYTKHIRHEEVSKAVITLWHSGKIATNKLWTFAYEDGKKAYYPKAIECAPIYQILDKQIWLEKYNIIIKTYGFNVSSWEAKTTPQAESFWQFSDALAAKEWLDMLLSQSIK